MKSPLRRPALEGAVRAWWDGGGGAGGALLSLLLLPVSALFRGGVFLRNTAYDRGWRKQGRGAIPVVSVGNLSVGGTGKTPVTAWLAATVAGMGERPAIVSRGYGRDELALHARWNPHVPVYRAADRVAGIRSAAEAGATVALLDDGFQHRRAERDLDLVLLAAEQPFPPRLLPRGPFREPLSSLARADLVLLTRKSATSEDADRLESAIVRRHPGIGIVRIHLRPARWEKLGGDEASAPQASVLAVSSIAGPDAFVALVRAAMEEAAEGGAGGGADVSELSYPDHHDYDADDIERIAGAAGGRTLVTTEKDAVKLVAFADRLPEVRVLRLQVAVERGDELLRSALGRLVATVGHTRAEADGPGSGPAPAPAPPPAPDGRPA